jgi:phage-related protein
VSTVANEVTILVKAKNQAGRVLTRAKAQVAELGKEAGGTAKKIDDMGAAEQRTTRRTAELGAATREVTREVGNQGEKVDRLQRRLRTLSLGKYEVEVDIDRDGRLSRGFSKVTGAITGLVTTAGGAAAKMGEKFVSILPGAIGGAFQAAGPVVQTAAVALGVVIVAALSSFIAAGLSAGILAALGGGVLVAGIASALQSDKIDQILNGKKVVTRSALNAKGDKTPNFGEDVETRVGGLVPKIKDAFTSFGAPFIDPLARALDRVNEALDKAAPKASEIAQRFAPLVDKLAPALMAMAERAWPGIQAALEASVPLLETLAGYLPAIGAAIGFFFQTIADHGPAANQAFGQILGLIGTTIIYVARVIELLLRMYEKIMQIKDAFGRAISGAGWLSGPISAVSRLLALIDNALFKRNQLEGGTSGQARTLGSGAPAGTSRGALARASGGIAGGLTRVAERGGELIKLPQGSMVYASGQSQQMIAQADRQAPAGKQVVELRVTGSGPLYEMLTAAMRGGELQVPATAVV